MYNLVCKAFKTKVDNQNVTVEVYEIGRVGTKSPSYYYYRYNNRWITPYEQKKRAWADLTLSDLFTISYQDAIQNFVPNFNPFLECIPKDDLYEPVILGLEHGVKFKG